jgi:DUF4097 and DUF4098 domain-containing protein YvlB
MRRTITGPLILIAIGVIFLLRNVFPEIPLWDLFSRYWPFVLIAWGGLRLIEVLVLATMSRPLPRNAVSGGEWVLVVMIFVVGSATYAAHNAGWMNGNWRGPFISNFGEPYDYPLASAERSAGKTPRIVIENFRGSARITGAATDKVQVTGRKTIRAMEQRDADQADKQTQFELLGGADLITVRLNQDRVSDRLRVSHDLDITVPKGASVECHGRYGDFDVRDIEGGVDIESDNAGVRLQNIGGNVKINLRKSDIVRAVDVKGTVDVRGRGDDVELDNIAGQVTMEGTYTGQLQFRNLAQPLRFDGVQTEIKVARTPGELRVSPGDLVAYNLVGPIQINARSRDVQIADFTQSLDLTVDRGDIELRPSITNPPKLDVRTRSGDIDLGLPVTGRFDLKAQTDHGEIHDEFGTPLKTSEVGDGGELSGTLGSGPAMRVATNRGSITVRKSGPEDMRQPAEKKEAPDAEDGARPPSQVPAPKPPKRLPAPPKAAPAPSAPTTT